MYLIYIVTLLVCYFVGKIYIDLFFSKEQQTLQYNSFTIASLNLSVGIIIIVVLTAVFSTFFKTLYLWPFVFILIPIFKNKKNSISIVFKNIKKGNDTTLFFILATIIFLLNFITFYNIQKSPFYDFLFLGKISSGLISFHSENLFAGYGSFYANPTQMLYHYSDLWLTGLISLITQVSETKTLIYITYPVLNFATLLISISIFSHFITSKIFYILGGFGLFYGIKLFLPISTPFWELVINFRGIPFVYSFKLLPIYLIGLMAMLLYMNDHKKYTFILFSFIPIFYPTSIPAFLAIAVFLLINQVIVQRNTNRSIRDRLHDAWLILASILFIILFKVFVTFEQTADFVVYVYPFKTYFVFFFETIFKIFSEHFIIIFILFYVIWEKKLNLVSNQIFQLTILGIIGAYFFDYYHSRDNQDINQVLWNVSPILVMLLFIELLNYLPKNKIKYIVLITTLFGVYNIFFVIVNKNKYSQRVEQKQSEIFIQKTIHEIELNSLKSNTCSISKGQSPRWFYDINNPFNFLMMSKTPAPLEIGVLFYGDVKVYSKSIANQSYPPIKFFKDKEVTILSILTYLKENDVKYLLIEDYQSISPAFLANLTLISIDKITKNSLWKLNTLHI